MAASGTSNSPQGKKDRREAARETARLEREAEKKRQRRNKILLQGGIGVAILAVIAIVVAIVVQPAAPGAPGPKNMASNGILFTGKGGVVTPTTTAAAAADGKPKKTDTSDGLAHISTYVDWACPACKSFEATYAAQIQQLVASGSATLEVHPISILDRNYGTSRYASRAANAAACIANFDPKKFLDAQKVFYDKQPAEGSSGLTDSQLKALVKDAGISDSSVTRCIDSEKFKAWVVKSTQVTTGNASLLNPAASGFSTPTVVVNGKRWDGTGDFLQFAATAAGITPPPTPTPTP